MSKVSKEDALKYHSEGKAGKIEVIPTKPYSTQPVSYTHLTLPTIA